MQQICISYPKSGRTWLRVMLDDLNVKTHFTHVDAGTDLKSFGRPFSKLNTTFPVDCGTKVMFLHRDPRDTTISLFHHIMKRELPLMKFSTRARIWMRNSKPSTEISQFIRQPGFGVEKVIVYNLSWAEALSKGENVVFLNYEIMRADPLRSLSILLDKLEVQATPERIAKTVENSQFEKMQLAEADGSLAQRYGMRLRPGDQNDLSSYKVRKGKVGGFRDEMSDEDIQYCSSVLKRYDYFNAMQAFCGRMSE